MVAMVQYDCGAEAEGCRSRRPGFGPCPKHAKEALREAGDACRALTEAKVEAERTIIRLTGELERLRPASQEGWAFAGLLCAFIVKRGLLTELTEYLDSSERWSA